MAPLTRTRFGTRAFAALRSHALAGAAVERHHGEVIGPGGARLLRSDDLGQVAWIQERVSDPGTGLGSIIPTGFPAYVRVLHPAEGPWPEQPGPVRWAEVAERAGVTMHASIDFDELVAALDRRAGP